MNNENVGESFNCGDGLQSVDESEENMLHDNVGIPLFMLYICEGAAYINRAMEWK